MLSLIYETFYLLRLKNLKLMQYYTNHLRSDIRYVREETYQVGTAIWPIVSYRTECKNVRLSVVRFGSLISWTTLCFLIWKFRHFIYLWSAIFEKTNVNSTNLTACCNLSKYPSCDLEHMYKWGDRKVSKIILIKNALKTVIKVSSTTKCFFRDSNHVRLKLFMWMLAYVFSETRVTKRNYEKKDLVTGSKYTTGDVDIKNWNNKLTTTNSICHVFVFAMVINCSGKTNVFLIEKWFSCDEQNIISLYNVHSIRIMRVRKFYRK